MHARAQYKSRLRAVTRRVDAGLAVPYKVDLGGEVAQESPRGRGRRLVVVGLAPRRRRRQAQRVLLGQELHLADGAERHLPPERQGAAAALGPTRAQHEQVRRGDDQRRVGLALQGGTVGQKVLRGVVVEVARQEVEQGRREAREGLQNPELQQAGLTRPALAQGDKRQRGLGSARGHGARQRAARVVGKRDGHVASRCW